jgi:hypothetical protein
MWTCPNCQQRLEERFDCCWPCATDLEENVAAELRDADVSDTVYHAAADHSPCESRFTLWSLMVSVTSLCVIFAVIGKGGGPLLLFFVAPVLVIYIFGGVYAFVYRWVLVGQLAHRSGRDESEERTDASH